MKFIENFKKQFEITTIDWVKAANNFQLIGLFLFLPYFVFEVSQLFHVETTFSLIIRVLTAPSLLLGLLWLLTAKGLKRANLKILPFARFLPIVTCIVLIPPIFFEWLDAVGFGDMDEFNGVFQVLFWIVNGGYLLYFFSRAIRCIIQYQHKYVESDYQFPDKEFVHEPLEMSGYNSGFVSFIGFLTLLMMIMNVTESLFENDFWGVLIFATLIGLFLFHLFNINKKSFFFKGVTPVLIATFHPKKENQFKALIFEDSIELKEYINSYLIPFKQLSIDCFKHNEYSLNFPDSLTQIPRGSSLSLLEDEYKILLEVFTSYINIENPLPETRTEREIENEQVEVTKKASRSFHFSMAFSMIVNLLFLGYFMFIFLNSFSDEQLNDIEGIEFKEKYPHINQIPSSYYEYENRLTLTYTKNYQSQIAESPKKFINATINYEDTNLVREIFTTAYYNVLYHNKPEKTVKSYWIPVPFLFYSLTSFFVFLTFSIMFLVKGERSKEMVMKRAKIWLIYLLIGYAIGGLALLLINKV